MFRTSVVVLTCAAMAVRAPNAAAQPRGIPGTSQNQERVPPSAMPPAGMCRIWLANVPERQQPAPTDCATAIRSRPRSARLLFGDLREQAAHPPRTGGATSARGAAREEPSFRSIAPGGTRALVRQGGTASAPSIRATPVGAQSSGTRPVPDSAKPIKPEKPR